MTLMRCALLYSVSLGTGHIYDYFGGKGDLEKKIVRFVGEPEERITGKASATALHCTGM